MELLKINDVTYGYPGNKRAVLEDVELEIKPGHVYGLLGVNGAGKSTLLYLMAGVLTPDSGVVTYGSKDVRRREPSVTGEIFVLTEETDVPQVSVGKFARDLGALYPRYSHEEMMSRLERMGLQPSMRLEKLSMGQRKKVMICFALSCNTSVLLMDEPTNGLDIPGKDVFRSMIAEAMTEERAIVISTHQVRDIDLIIDHVTILDRGRIVLDEDVSEIDRRLKFGMVTGSADRTNVLYSRPTPGGTEIVTRNDDGEETGVDVEMLFNLAVSRPNVIQTIFEKK